MPPADMRIDEMLPMIDSLEVEVAILKAERDEARRDREIISNALQIALKRIDDIRQLANGAV